MKKVYAEAGFGNETFFSTEIEEDGKEEHRIPKFVKPQNVAAWYVRLWVGKRVFILSTDDGFSMKRKERNTFKLLFGISGTEEKRMR